jgi:hypothetical protein
MEGSHLTAPQPERPWWHKPLRVIQTNMQVKDTHRIIPDELARQMVEMGANALVFNTGGIYAWYPTAVRFHTVNDYLPQDRDLLAELIFACHKHGLKFIARFDFSKVDDAVYQQRPGWFARQAGGEPEIIGQRRPGAWSLLVSTCLNSAYRNEAVAAPVIREVLDRYAIDGIFFNAPHYVFCRCERCDAKYRRLYGTSIPATRAELAKDFPVRCFDDNTAFLYRTIKEHRPEVPMILYYSPQHDNLEERVKRTDLLCTEPQDVLSRGAAHIPEFWQPALGIKVGRSVPGRPAPFGIVHSSPGMDWRHTGLPTDEYRFWLAQIPANGGQIWHSLTGIPDTITDKRILRTVTELNRHAAIVESEMDGAQPVAEIALLWNGNRSAEAFADALINKQLLFDVLLPEQMTAERLKSFPVLLLPEDSAVSAELYELLLHYVQEGGRIVAEGLLSAEQGQLKTLFGTVGETFASEPLIASYLRFEGADNPLQIGLTETELIPHCGRVMYCDAAADTKVLATLVPPFAPLDAVGAPPERASLSVTYTDLPLALHRTTGQGSTVYLPFSLSALLQEFRLEEHYQLFSNTLDLALGDHRKVAVTSYPGLQLTAFCQDQVLLVHLVNGAGRRPLARTLPLHQIEVVIRLDGKLPSGPVQAVLQGTELASSVSGGMLRIVLPVLNVWECVRIPF